MDLLLRSLIPLTTAIIIFSIPNISSADNCSKGQRYKFPNCLTARYVNNIDFPGGSMIYNNNCGYEFIIKVDISGGGDKLHYVTAGSGGQGISMNPTGFYRLSCCGVMMRGGCGGKLTKKSGRGKKRSPDNSHLD